MIRYRDADTGQFVSANAAAEAQAMRSMGDDTAPRIVAQDIAYSWEDRAAEREKELDEINDGGGGFGDDDALYDGYDTGDDEGS